MMNLKKVLTVGLVLAVLLIAFFVSVTLKTRVEDKRRANNNQQNTNQATNNNSNSSNPIADEKARTGTVVGNTYTNTKYGFSFQFAGLSEFEKIGYNITVPNGQYSMNIDDLITFRHTVEAEYCSPRGDCVPTTTDMIFGVSAFSGNLSEYAKSNPQLTKAPKGVTTYTYSYNEGAEGEGINYFFIQLANNNIAVVYHQYIDETVLASYKSVPDFIKYKLQQQRISNLLKSFEY